MEGRHRQLCPFAQLRKAIVECSAKVLAIMTSKAQRWNGSVVTYADVDLLEPCRDHDGR